MAFNVSVLAHCVDYVDIDVAPQSAYGGLTSWLEEGVNVVKDFLDVHCEGISSLLYLSCITGLTGAHILSSCKPLSGSLLSLLFPYTKPCKRPTSTVYVSRSTEQYSDVEDT